MADTQSFFEKIIKDKQGKVVLWQSPNLPLTVWIVALLLGKLFAQGTIHNLFSLLSFGALFTWAWLELFMGTSWFRRGLGFLILVVSFYSRVR